MAKIGVTILAPDESQYFLDQVDTEEGKEAVGFEHDLEEGEEKDVQEEEGAVQAAVEEAVEIRVLFPSVLNHPKFLRTEGVEALRRGS